MPFTVLEDPDGKPVTAKATEDGVALVSSVGADGEALATEATALAVEENTAALADLIGNFQPATNDAALSVVITRAPTLMVQIAEGQTASATPASDAQRIVVGVVDLAPAIPVGEEGSANPVTVLGVAQVAGAVDQGRANPDERWSVTDTTTEAAVNAVETELQDKATEAKQDATIAAIQAAEATIEADKATATGQAAELAAVDELESKLGTLAAQEATTAKDTSVDGLEGAIQRRGTPADSTSTNSGAGAVSGLIFSGANTLRSIDAINLGAVGLKYTLMVFNATALPADGATPVFRVPLPGGGSAHWDRGKSLSVGAYWAISTTDATLTVSGVANAVVDAEYGGT